MSLLPLVERPLGDLLAEVDGRAVTVAQFLGDVAAVAEQLPAVPQIVATVTERYRFTVLFAAALCRGITLLLPPRRDPQSLQSLRREFTDLRSVGINDSAADVDLAFEPARAEPASVVPAMPGEQLAALAFTSGSTGESQRHAKSWALLAHSAAQHWQILPSAWRQPLTLIGTVPPWHMYGFEWSVLLPTRAPVTVYCGADFYPVDVLRALDRSRGPNLLVSTPLHLRALLRAAESAAVVPAQRKALLAMSATAPLEPGLAAALRARLAAELLEIYGCSEIGSLAWRQPLVDEAFRFFPWLTLAGAAGAEQTTLRVQSPYLREPVVLADQFARRADGSYRLLGRDTDLVKVAGKRESLQHLNQILTSLPGVEDGVFYAPDQLDLPAVDRLGALVVAPGLEAATIRQQLAKAIDPVFLPRPLRLVSALPRDPSSKLRRARLREFVLGLTSSHEQG